MRRAPVAALAMLLLWQGWGLLSAQSGDASAAREKANRARQLMEAGQAAEAAEIYEDLARQFPRNGTLKANLGLALYAAGRYARAIEVSEEALNLDAGLYAALLAKGGSLFHTGAYETAVEALSSAVEAYPSDRNARLLRAEALAKLERHAAAAREFAELTRLIPDGARVWFGLAWSCRSLVGDGEEAPSVCTGAKGRFDGLPRAPQHHEWRARVLEEQGKYAAAAAAWAEAASLAVNQAPNYNAARARALYLASDFDAAEALVRELRGMDPHSADLSYVLGATLLEQSRAAEALAHLEAALGSPQFGRQAHAALGRALLEQGRASEALAHLEAGLPADTDGSIHYQLARAYQLAGRKADAQKMLDAYEAVRESSQGARQP